MTPDRVPPWARLPLVGQDCSITAVAPMPSPIQNFPGLTRTDTCSGGQCGAGTPPDTNGDVGPNNYIQAVNEALGKELETRPEVLVYGEDVGQAGGIFGAEMRGEFHFAVDGVVMLH